MRQRTRITLAALVLAGLWGGYLGLLHLRGDLWFLDRIEATMVDIRTQIRGVVPPPDGIALVAIDDRTATAEGRYPMRRATLARLIEAIKRHGPSAIAVDLLLVDAGPDDGDQALARALSGSPTVIAAAAVFAGGAQWVATDGADPLSALPDAESFLLPLKLFSDAAAVGMVNIATDTTGTPRFVPLALRSGDRVEASLPLRVVALASRTEPELGADELVLGDRTVATDRGHLLPLNFYGPRGTIATISAAEVLAGDVPPDRLSGRIVVIGSTVTGGGDVFPTPFDPVLPGAEVIATAIAHLAAGDGLVRDHRVRLADAATGVVLPLVLVALVGWRRSAIGLVAVVGVIAVWLGANILAFANDIWLSAALPMTAAAPPLMLFGAAQLWFDRNRAQYFATQSELLQRVQAPGLGAWLARHRDFLSEPVEAELAVVFIDLSGFTRLSQTLGPAATREILSQFHRLVDEEVTAGGGIVSSFLGDGAMILFGLPEPSADDARQAADCCVRLAGRARAWLDALPAATASGLGFKLGAHHGTIVASRLGGEKHQHLAATGDTVNVANRLMETAAAHGAQAALSDELMQAAGPDCAPFRAGAISGPAETDIRGRAGTLTVWLWRDQPN